MARTGEASIDVHVSIHHYHVTPRQGLLQLLKSGKYVDVTFVVSGSSVPAHRAIVASQSDYFDRLLYGHMKEARASKIVLEDTPLEAFQLLLEYMYSGSVTDVDLQTALDLLGLADRYGIELLQESLEERLCALINKTNVLQFLFGTELINAPKLHQLCTEFTDGHAATVLEDDSFLYQPLEHLKSLLSRDTFLVDEVLVFRAVCRWMEHNHKKVADATELLMCVRLAEIPEQYLEDVIRPSGFYSRSSIDDAIRVQRGNILDKMLPRGRKGKNLFEDKHTRLVSYNNYKVIESRDKFPCAKAATDLEFRLIQDATIEISFITLKFSELYLINELKFEAHVGYARLQCSEELPFCYYVEVSKDELHWNAVVDYSNLRCYSKQKLYFPKVAARYLRIVQTRGQEALAIRLYSCSYVGSGPYETRKNGIMAPLVPISPAYNEHFTQENSHGPRCFLMFHQPYLISYLRFKVKGLEGSGQITVSVATHNKVRSYKEVANVTGHCFAMDLEATFIEKPVSIVSITILLLFNSKGERQPLQSVKVFSVQDVVCQSC